MKKAERIDFIDYLNVLSCIAVIALHCNGCFWNFSYERYWKTSVFIECFFYWAVPCFFMITGATLIDYRNKYSTKTFFEKRFWRSVVPFLFWSIVWILYTKMYKGKGLMELIDILINAKANGVYWFFPALFSVYLAIPVLGFIDEHKKILAFNYMIFISLITNSILPMLFSLSNVNYNYSLTSLISGGYMVYVLIGYLLVHYYNSLCFRTRMWIYLCGLCGFAARALTVLIWSLEDGKINNTLGGVFRSPYSSVFSSYFYFLPI